MSARAAPAFGAVLSLALLGVGPCHALSLRSSAAESFLGDVLPGTTVVYSRVAGARLRVEDAGSEPVRVEFKVVSPPQDECVPGFEPWPDPSRVRVETFHPDVKPGEAAEAELSVSVPKSLGGGQYQFDVWEVARDRSGASLTLKTRVLLSAGAPLAPDDAAGGEPAERPGFVLTPRSASGREATVKIVNAGEEDLNVTVSPARSGEERIREGYAPAPNPRWLRFDPGVVRVRAGAVGRARIWVDLPKQKRYAGGRWAFTAAVDAAAGGRRTRRYFVLYVNSDDAEVETRAR